jgi:hypothetical protein
MYRYAPFCNLVTVCNTLRHLERVITDILEDAAWNVTPPGCVQYPDRL